MTVTELIEKLKELPESRKQLPVHVQDGMDPSDPTEARQLVYKPGDHMWPERIELE